MKDGRRLDELLPFAALPPPPKGPSHAFDEGERPSGEVVPVLFVDVTLLVVEVTLLLPPPLNFEAHAEAMVVTPLPLAPVGRL